MGPCRVSVVSGSAVEDTDEPVGDLAESGVVLGAAGAELVVVAADVGVVQNRAGGLSLEGVDEPIVVNVAGRDDAHLPGLPGDRTGPRIVLAILGAAVTARGIPEFCEHPGTEDRAEAGLA